MMVTLRPHERENCRIQINNQVYLSSADYGAMLYLQINVQTNQNLDWGLRYIRSQQEKGQRSHISLLNVSCI